MLDFESGHLKDILTEALKLANIELTSTETQEFLLKAFILLGHDEWCGDYGAPGGESGVQTRREEDPMRRDGR